ncbi:MAG: PQQ-binding-like beta-propeller repeat protein [Thermoplasmata archaeon]
MIDYLRDLAAHYLRMFIGAWEYLKRSILFWTGLIILSAFCLISLIGPLAIRDPINWRAPQEDLIELDEYWEIDTSTSLYGGSGSTEYPVAVRLKPALFDPQSDRVYFASGRNLIAVNPSTGWRVWLNTSQAPSAHTCCFAVDSEISTAPVAVNFGSEASVQEEDQYVIVGTSEGTLYLLREERLGGIDEGLSPLPSGDNVVVLDLDGLVSSIAAFSDGWAGLSPKERIFAGTSRGTLYALSPNGTVLWSRSLGDKPVLMANLFPTRRQMRSSVCVDDDGARIFVNDGNLRALWTENGTDVWTEQPGGVFPMGPSWSSPPFLASPTEIEVDGGTSYVELIYAASDDGILYVVFPNNGTLLFSKYLDEGRLTTPVEGGSNIVVASSSGTVYVLRRDSVADLPRGYIRGTSRVEGEPTTPLYDVGTGSIFVGDSEGYLYSLRVDGTVSYRIRFEGRIQGHPIVWNDEMGSGHLHASVFVTNSPGMAHAISSVGAYLAPLAPGCYPSGNCYALGTDNQGRDVFAQLIAGFSVVWLTILVALLTVGIGTFLGTVSGFFGRWWTFFILLLVNVSFAFPILLLAILLAIGFEAHPFSHPVIFWILVVVLSAPVIKLIDVETRELKSSPHFSRLRSGRSRRDHYLRDVLPRMLVRGASYSKIVIPAFLFLFFALEFIGLGDIRTPGWGQMLMLVQQSNVLASWWWLLFPGICIFLLGFGFALLGQSLEELANKLYRGAFERGSELDETESLEPSLMGEGEDMAEPSEVDARDVGPPGI